ncbi:MAG: hypothetical protein KF812_12930 [Fimbriimonadaceae bacterium]|nr:hypothetical protein [Fimbriimonadaceae bacterium]
MERQSDNEVYEVEHRGGISSWLPWAIVGVAAGVAVIALATKRHKDGSDPFSEVEHLARTAEGLLNRLSA